MVKRLFVFIVLALIATMFFDLASGFRERHDLTEVSTRYVGQGPEELGAPNLVTAVVVTYRGLDTLGEVTVLFISAAGVGLLLGFARSRETDRAPERTPASELVETAVHYLLPLVVLLGVYIFVNGHLTPGGGFQGGSVIASGTMLLFLALPSSKLRHSLLALTESLSGVAYVAIGVLGIVLAGGFLDNRIFGLGTYGTLFSAGAIPLIYIFIGLKVGTELSVVLEHFRSE
jgi:multicomponent Na+:H+ antiporter subunit B